MSWKYSTSVPRESSFGRETTQSKYGYLNSKTGVGGLDRRSGWSSSVTGDNKYHRSTKDSVEHIPVWAKPSTNDNSTSVQRLKERYTINDEPPIRDIKSVTRTETKDLIAPKSAKFYGRSFTSLNVDEKPSEINTSYSKFRRKLDKSPEIEKNSFESKFNISLHSSSTPKCISSGSNESSKLLTKKYSDNKTPLSGINEHSKGFEIDKKQNRENSITVVTRGTSPTPIVSSICLRSRRYDYEIEKTIFRPVKKAETADKDMQTDREENSYSRYAVCVDSNVRTKSKPLYLDKYSYTPKYTTKSSYACENKKEHFSTFGGTSLNECKRSISREESDRDPITPDSPNKFSLSRFSLNTKTIEGSTIKEPDKKISVPKSPPSGFRLPLKCDNSKTDFTKNSISPNVSPSSPLQCKIVNVETVKSVSKVIENQLPAVTIENCPNIHHINVSSASESSEDESSSDDSDDQTASTAVIAKKSVTNFLQNIPNNVKQSQTKVNLNQKLNSFCPQKITFKRIESGEKAWWMENTDKVPDGVIKIKSVRSVPNQSPEFPPAKSPPSKHLLPPSQLPNGFFTNGKNRNEDEPSKFECRSPREENSNFKETELNNHSHFELPQFDQNGIFLNAHSPVNSFPAGNDTHLPMKFNLQSPRDCSGKEVSPKLQNGHFSPLEEKNYLDPGDMTGLISKAKADLSKAKLDIKRSSSRETSPMITDPKSEIDLYWKELADSVNRPLRLCDLDFTDLNDDDETDILGNLKINGEVPPPPPMLVLPVPTMTPLSVPAPPLAINQSLKSSKVPVPPPQSQPLKNKKTVKLFWKEVKDDLSTMKLKGPNPGALIWDELVAVKIDTQKLENLFESRAKDLISKKQQGQNNTKEIIVLDPKRSNAINIGMTKLPPPRAIKTAILKMDSTVVSKEGIEKLLSMLPTEEERLRIQEAQNLNPDTPLGSAEQFLLTLASITQLEARLRLWAFKLDFEISEKEICEPLMDLKQGMEILRINKTFRSILSTLLSVGNFLNGQEVKGFQIEYLSKVPEVKDTVYKHSLLHHLCIIVMEKFPDSTDLYSEIGAVTRASKVDYDELSASIKKLEDDCKLSWNYLKIIAKHEGHTAMKVKMSDFLADCAERIIILGIVHKRIMSRFQKFVFWLGVPVNRISTTRPHEIFKIISEFALEFRTTRERVLQHIKKMNREKSRTRGYFSNDHNDFVGKKMNSKEVTDDAKLKQLLENDNGYSEVANTPRWRRQRKDAKNVTEETNQNDEEIIETLIKTANQRSGLKERRRCRVYGKYCKFLD